MHEHLQEIAARYWLLKGEPPVMIMELPPYRLPRLKDVALHMMERAWIFVRRAGTVILGISIVLWFLASYPKAPADATPDTSCRPPLTIAPAARPPWKTT